MSFVLTLDEAILVLEQDCCQMFGVPFDHVGVFHEILQIIGVHVVIVVNLCLLLGCLFMLDER